MAAARYRELVVGTLGLALAACGAVEDTFDDAKSDPAERRLEARAPMWVKPALITPKAAACTVPTPLLVHRDREGRVDRLHAQLTARGEAGEFLIDTGSLASFATNQGAEEDKSADTVVYCTSTTLPIIARLNPGTTPDGQPQAGVLGADLVAHGWVLDLDLVKGHLGWYGPAPEAPPGAVVMPIEVRKGWLVVSGIRLEGRDVKLVLDTGASNVITMSTTPRAGETREDTVDGTASPITLFHSEGEIAFADGVTRHVPVDRSDNFATLSGLLEELGSDVVGLLGLTAMGRERIIIGPSGLMLVLPPAAAID